MEVTMYIYKITCKDNGKIYIGKTHKTTKERWKRHVNEAMNSKLDTLFARAIRKHGEDAFIVETIDQALDAKELQKKERYWIKYYNSNKTGYNMTDGGDGNNTYCRKTENEMNKIKSKIRKTKLGANNPHSCKVKCKNIKTGEVYHFGTAQQCTNFLGEKHHSVVTKRINHTHKTGIQYAYNKTWIFAKETEDFPENYITYRPCNKRIRTTVTNTKTGETKEYESITDTAKALNCNIKRLSKKLRYAEEVQQDVYIVRKAS